MCALTPEDVMGGLDDRLVVGGIEEGLEDDAVVVAMIGL